jgi:hypothetical protein
LRWVGVWVSFLLGFPKEFCLAFAQIVLVGLLLGRLSARLFPRLSAFENATDLGPRARCNIEAHARTEVCASKALNSTPFCGCSTDTVLCDKTKNIINI